MSKKAKPLIEDAHKKLIQENKNIQQKREQYIQEMQDAISKYEEELKIQQDSEQTLGQDINNKVCILSLK